MGANQPVKGKVDTAQLIEEAEKLEKENNVEFNFSSLSEIRCF